MSELLVPVALFLVISTVLLNGLYFNKRVIENCVAKRKVRANPHRRSSPVQTAGLRSSYPG
jgi:hypothetical protein